MKTIKAFTKRLKVTKSGKILSRKQGQNHFNAKERHASKTKKHGAVPITFTKKAISRYQLT